jgi:hypothetical protein
VGADAILYIVCKANHGQVDEAIALTTARPAGQGKTTRARKVLPIGEAKLPVIARDQLIEATLARRVALRCSPTPGRVDW